MASKATEHTPLLVENTSGDRSSAANTSYQSTQDELNEAQEHGGQQPDSEGQPSDKSLVSIIAVVSP